MTQMLISLLQWDLVCDKTTLVATAQSFLMVGKFIGVLCSGFLSDRFENIIHFVRVTIETGKWEIIFQSGNFDQTTKVG